jgi:hypothetical protein
MKVTGKRRKSVSEAERVRRLRQRYADQDRLLWSLDETAFKLSVHRQTILNLIKRGVLTDAWIGTRHMIVAASARALVEAKSA